jgi:hypothetical protein
LSRKVRHPQAVEDRGRDFSAGNPETTGMKRGTVTKGNMSFLSPGGYLRTKLIKPEYDLRSIHGDRLMSLPVKHASLLISSAIVFGKLNGSGDLEYLVALRTIGSIRNLIDKTGKSGGIGAEDNKTVVMDGQTFAHDMRRSRAFR